jgi:hypothetical protein
MDVSKLTMKELAEVEELAGVPMDLWQDSPKVKLTTAIAYVIGKKSNPDLTFDQVQNMSIDEMQQIAEDKQAPKAKNS